jgi:putative tricarboxylic transport membrane protein
LSTSKSKIKTDYDALVGIVVALVGLIYSIAAYNLPRSTVGTPLSPSYFPLLLGGVMVVLGISLFLRSSMENTKESLNALKNSSAKEKENSKLILLTVIICVLYAVLFDHLGYVISTFLFVDSMLYLTNKKDMKKNAIISLIFSVLIFFIFSELLGIVLPPVPFLNI